MKIYDNNNKTSTGGGTVSWKYYNAFCNIFDNDRSVAMDHILSSMTVMTENNRSVNPDILDLPPLDLTHPQSSDLLNDEGYVVDNPSCSHEKEITVRSTGNKKVKRANTLKRNYDAFRKATLEVEKEKLQEAKKLHKSIEEMVNLQKERNRILEDISNSLRNGSQ